MADTQKATRQLTRLEQSRIEATAASIPRTVTSILDAGSGEGWLSNRLADHYDVTAVDHDLDALSHVKSRKTQADVARLPFGGASFDMVCCCETLEHLDDQRYRSAVREIARVARKYALITVPNEENLGSLYTKCPRCGAKFSPYGHVRSFAARDLPGLFAAQDVGGMKCVAVKGIVPVKVWRQSALLLRLRPERVGFWLRGRQTPYPSSIATRFLRKLPSSFALRPSPFAALCPHCGFEGCSRLLSPLWHIWSLGLRLLNALLHPIRRKRTCWLLALYAKEQ